MLSSASSAIIFSHGGNDCRRPVECASRPSSPSRRVLMKPAQLNFPGLSSWSPHHTTPQKSKTPAAQFLSKARRIARLACTSQFEASHPANTLPISTTCTSFLYPHPQTSTPSTILIYKEVFQRQPLVPLRPCSQLLFSCTSRTLLGEPAIHG